MLDGFINSFHFQLSWKSDMMNSKFRWSFVQRRRNNGLRRWLVVQICYKWVGENLLMRYAELKVPTFLKVEVALAVISPAIWFDSAFLTDLNSNAIFLALKNRKRGGESTFRFAWVFIKLCVAKPLEFDMCVAFHNAYEQTLKHRVELT